MDMSGRWATRTVLLLLPLVALAATVDGTLLWRNQRWNDAIASGQLPADGDDLPLQVRFAQAHALAASGGGQEALRRYRRLEGDSPLGQAARFNSANLLMREAISVRAGIEPGKAIALIELAKEIYREVLRVDPQQWDARYNLERAQRLLPDPDEQEPATAEPQPKAERAATTMRGYSPGLP
ncbi:MAG: hypothetical protein ABI212_10135 [Burkholderiaceae bacterium]